MPSIEITAEQAAALARDENVTVSPAPKPDVLHIAVSHLGAVWEFWAPADYVHAGGSIDFPGVCVRYPHSSSYKVGSTVRRIGGLHWTVVKCDDPRAR